MSTYGTRNEQQQDGKIILNFRPNSEGDFEELVRDYWTRPKSFYEDPSSNE